MADVPWSCACGAMKGHIKADGGTRAVCHCSCCVRAQRHFGIEVTPVDGVGVFQTSPDRFSIEAGSEHLRLARLTPKGSYRWYAGCCGRQIGVTASTPKFPFVSVVDSVVEDPNTLGRVRAHVFVQQAGGGTKSYGTGRVVMALMGRALGALTSGRWRKTPFFDVATGKPTAEPEILPKDAGRA
ncbi:DUF6151 family protein [Gymnodinialimonas sp. 2305UL16-5]|uniref:DUF6151 family protein n=1 Tax=Gymnodinialimonas mytili TaxID=3126503 RepID=UPI0030AE50E3